MDPRYTYLCTLCVYIRTSPNIGMEKKIKNKKYNFLPTYRKKIGSAFDSKQEIFFLGLIDASRGLHRGRGNMAFFWSCLQIQLGTLLIYCSRCPDKESTKIFCISYDIW